MNHYDHDSDHDALDKRAMRIAGYSTLLVVLVCVAAFASIVIATVSRQ